MAPISVGKIGNKQSISYVRIDKEFSPSDAEHSLSRRNSIENENDVSESDQLTSSHSSTSASSSSMCSTLYSYPGHIYQTLKLSFKSLESCPKELYVNFVLKFFESYSYFAISQILVLYLHTGQYLTPSYYVYV